MSATVGKLIVIEGLEGAGKSTAVRTVVDFLTQREIKTITTREPGGTDIGEILRQVIKDPKYKGVLNDKSELLLLYTARIQLLEQMIKPALRRGYWVIADRFELSTMAYQGGGRGLDEHIIQQLSIFALNGFAPNLTIYLDINPEEGMKRVKSRGEFDRIEQQPIDFFHRVHECYIRYVRETPNAVLIDANQTLPTVQQAIKKALSDFLEQ
ncbi:MAG: dTMP kinase [Legionella sp.]|uniref:dTMP kinase n=1 Tax=Legionella sp. TaxID=459 RepID=UPI0039E495D3